MLTYTGRTFYPMDPRADDIDPRDIAHALGMQCRYNGHVRRYYSVGEHCVKMSQTFTDPHLALWALLHDATEAYVGDMIRPLKRSMPEYVAAEGAVMVQIGMKFGLFQPERVTLLQEVLGFSPSEIAIMPHEVEDADNRILLTEREVLLNQNGHSWGHGLEELEPLDVEIECWSPGLAEHLYLRRLNELIGEC